MMAALDLFCGGGGASLGLKRAGFEVTGVDHIRQKEYPYDFWLSDVLTLSPHILRVFNLIGAGLDLFGADADAGTKHICFMIIKHIVHFGYLGIYSVSSREGIYEKRIIQGYSPS